MNSPATTHITHEQLLTTAYSFHHYRCLPKEEFLMQVLPGAPVIDALNASNCLLAAACKLCDQMMEGTSSPTEVYGLHFLIEASRALLIATTASVEFGNRQGGEK